MQNSQLNEYYFMKDEILIKNDPEMSSYSQIIFTLSDKGRVFNKDLINKYTYRIESYDSVSIKLVLVDFVVLLLF